MKILRTSDISAEALEAFQSDLRDDFIVELDDSLYGFKSADPPSWIKLAADLAWWQQALAAYSALYVAEIVKEAAKDSWRSRAKAISAVVGAGTKIKQLAQAIGKLGLNLKSNSQIVLFVPVPNGYFGTGLLLSRSDAELSELEIALFVHHLPQLEELIAGHASDNIQPSTGYFLELLDNGDIQVTWYDSETIQKQTVALPFNGSKV